MMRKDQFLDIYIYIFVVVVVFVWLHWVFVAVRGPSLVAESRGHSSLRWVGLSLRWPLLLWGMGSRRTGLGSCGSRAQQLLLAGSRAQAQ